MIASRPSAAMIFEWFQLASPFLCAPTDTERRELAATSRVRS
jgi:hypothetical protein